MRQERFTPHVTTVYTDSYGQYHTDHAIMERYESGEWRFCMGDGDGRELAETDDGELLMLVPLGETEQSLTE